MELSTVVGLLIAVVVVVILMKVMGKVVSLVLSIVGVILVVWLVVVGLRWMDENNVRQNFMESNNLFVLEDEGSLVTGFATKEGMPDPDVTAFSAEEFTNPNSPLYDDYYKIVVVQKEALPEKTSLLVDVVEDEDRLSLFRNYVDDELLDQDDFVSTLVEEEKEGKIKVHKETLAFKHGLGEVLSS